MITEWIINLGIALADWFVSLLGTDDPPEWLNTLATWLGGLVASASGLGVWIPWALGFGVSGIVLALWLSGFLIKGVRWLVGLIPTMGGG